MIFPGRSGFTFLVIAASVYHAEVYPSQDSGELFLQLPPVFLRQIRVKFLQEFQESQLFFPIQIGRAHV